MHQQTHSQTSATNRSKAPRPPSKAAIKRAKKMLDFVDQLHAKMAAEGRPMLDGPSDLDWDENGLEK